MKLIKRNQFFQVNEIVYQVWFPNLKAADKKKIKNFEGNLSEY